MRFLLKVLPLVVIFSFASCEVKIPGNVIPPAKMETFLYDYHMVQSMSGEYASDEYKEKLFYSHIFRKHGIGKEQFDYSMKWYNRYPKHLKRIYENLSTRLEAEVAELESVKLCQKEGVLLDMVSMEGDTVDLWVSSRIKEFSSNSLNNRLLFSFDVPDGKAFLKGDSLSFSFMANFVSPATVSQEAYASIRLDYDDSTSCTAGVRVDTVGRYLLSAPRNYDSRLKSMCGFVYYTDNDTAAVSRMLLHDISVYRIHPPKE